ncbi:MAG: FecR family protein [Cyanobacteria bacterium P01_G01_bin.67]
MQEFFPRNPQYFVDLLQKLTCGLCIAFFSSNSVSASVIKQAEIYKTRNQVELNSGQNPDWQEAQPGDVIVPQDSVRTGANSRADILFNEGTLVRTGAGTTFRFPPGKRSFELTSGAALIMIRPEQGQSTINTPEAKVVSQGTALFVQHNPQSNSSLIGVLTNSPAGLVEVSSADGKISLQLQAGQFVSIVQGVVGLVEHFVLPMFYETVELSAGLGMEPEAMEAMLSQESSEVQATIRAVQAEAIDPLQNQLAWLQGFCKLRVEAKNIAPLLQLLGISASGANFNLEIPKTDLSVIPFRSLEGVTWLGNYCQGNQTLPPIKSE